MSTDTDAIAGLVERARQRGETMNGAHPVGAGDGDTYVATIYHRADSDLDVALADALEALARENEKLTLSRSAWEDSARINLARAESAEARLESVEVELPSVYLSIDLPTSVRVLARDLTAARARIEALEEGLRPFAEVVENGQFCMNPDDLDLDVFRRADALINKEQPAPPDPSWDKAFNIDESRDETGGNDGT